MEVFLAELVFSTNDVRSDIMANYEKASTEAFRTFLTAKASESEDLEERAALKSLLQTVEETVRMVDLSNKAEERAQAARIEEDDERMRQANLEDKPAAMSSKDVLAQADNIDGVGVTASNAASAAASQAAPAASFLESEVSPEIMESYRPLLAQLLPPYAPGSNVVDAVKEKYEETDAQLLKILAAMPGADAQAVLDAIGDEQQKRIAAATELLRAVLGAGSVERMEGEIVKLSREDKIDESFLLLLEANAEQAKAAGALDAEAVMRRLKVKADKEKDRSTKAVEVRLLRQLLRETDEKKREDMLIDAFTPKEQLIVPGNAENARKVIDGDVVEPEAGRPDVEPPKFIDACKAVMLNFGNISADGQNLQAKIQVIASEAEIVATRIYGQGQSSEEQQDQMFEDGTTSIFELENLELDAMQRGEVAPWAKDGRDDHEDMPPMFDADGKMKIGGT